MLADKLFKSYKFLNFILNSGRKTRQILKFCARHPRPSAFCARPCAQATPKSAKSLKHQNAKNQILKLTKF